MPLRRKPLKKPAKVGKKTIVRTGMTELESGATVGAKVRVFPPRVTRQFQRWPEKRQRRTQWRVAVTGLALAGGATIKDAASNNAVLTGAVTNPVGVLQIDTKAPTIKSVTTSGAGITAGNGDLDAGKVVILTADFSEKVTVTGHPVLKLNDGGLARYVSGSGTTALTFAYTVAAGQDTADLTVTGLTLAGSATIKDAAGNNAVLSGAITNPAGVLQIDTKAPTVRWIGHLEIGPPPPIGAPAPYRVLLIKP